MTGKGIWWRHGGEHRAALYTRSTHIGIGKPGSAEAISAMASGRIVETEAYVVVATVKFSPSWIIDVNRRAT